MITKWGAGNWLEFQVVSERGKMNQRDKLEVGFSLLIILIEGKIEKLVVRDCDVSFISDWEVGTSLITLGSQWRNLNRGMKLDLRVKTILSSRVDSAFDRSENRGRAAGLEEWEIPKWLSRDDIEMFLRCKWWILVTNVYQEMGESSKSKGHHDF